MERHAAATKKRITSKVYSEAQLKQAEARHREAYPYMRCNKLAVTAGKTWKMKLTDK